MINAQANSAQAAAQVNAQSNLKNAQTNALQYGLKEQEFKNIQEQQGFESAWRRKNPGWAGLLDNINRFGSAIGTISGAVNNIRGTTTETNQYKFGKDGVITSSKHTKTRKRKR